MSAIERRLDDDIVRIASDDSSNDNTPLLAIGPPPPSADDTPTLAIGPPPLPAEDNSVAASERTVQTRLLETSVALSVAYKEQRDPSSLLEQYAALKAEAEDVQKHIVAIPTQADPSQEQSSSSGNSSGGSQRVIAMGHEARDTARQEEWVHRIPIDFRIAGEDAMQLPPIAVETVIREVGFLVLLHIALPAAGRFVDFVGYPL